MEDSGFLGRGFSELGRLSVRASRLKVRGILGGSGDLVSRVISKVTIVISTYDLI